MRTNHTGAGLNRRDIIKGTAGLGAASLAGCLGFLDDDGFELVIGASSRGSTSFAMTQAIQRAADLHSETLSITATAPGGDPAAIRGVDQGEADGNTAGNFVMNAAKQSLTPFDEAPVDTLGHMAFTYLVIHMYWLSADPDIRTFDDAIEQGADIWGFPAGWGLRSLLRTILAEAGREEVEELFVDVAAEDVAGAIEEDRVQVFAAYGNNFINLAGWEVEVDARHDVHHVEMPDWFWEAAQASPALTLNIPEYGWEQDLDSPGEYRSWADGFNYYIHPDFPDEGVYEFLDLTHNHWDTAQEANPAYFDHSDIANMTGGYWDHPVHTGAAEWLQENGGWDDDTMFTEG